jgi:glycosyltransferase involved in cell wall biosynthesis/Uri superfamily endonuclease
MQKRSDKNKRDSNNKNSPLNESVYAGIEMAEYGFYVYIVGGSKNKKDRIHRKVKRNIEEEILECLKDYSLKNNVKFVAAGIIKGEYSRDLASKLWLKHDIVPFIVEGKGSDSEARTKNAVLRVLKSSDDKDLVKVKIKRDNEVDVARLVKLEDYKKTMSKREFDRLLFLAERFRNRKGKLVFISSTPQGGGVALMRHALIRLFRLLDIDAHWHVMIPDKRVFKITKIKFHNMLQAVSNCCLKLTKEDKDIYNSWIRRNAEIFKEVFEKSSVIVIDDPQPSGLIPYIKKINPKAKIIYRSHIQLETCSMSKRSSAQKELYNFVLRNANMADLFVSHPIKKFIPPNVDIKKTVLMPATTDLLDGLNKHLFKNQVKYYLGLFNEILAKGGQKPLNLRRKYIIQVARFDPSKGIPDVIESYRKLREKLGNKRREIPQLVIVGNGAIDDPEGEPIYNSTINMLNKKEYISFRSDVKVARLPHNDQILNALLGNSYIALQLSIKEGFEVKVTEALKKGKPVIAYKTGGIPLQIENGISGYLVKVGDTDKVAEKIYELLVDKKKYEQMSREAKKRAKRTCFTSSNAVSWLFLATELIENGKVDGNGLRVSKLISMKEKDIGKF